MLTYTVIQKHYIYRDGVFIFVYVYLSEYFHGNKSVNSRTDSFFMTGINVK